MARPEQQLISVITGTPIDKRTRSWNCQHWVEAGIRRVANQRWMGGRTNSEAISAMVDVIVETKDEED